MGKYFYLQWKRVAKYLPGAIVVVLILMAGLLVAFSAMTNSAAGSEDNQKIQVALCGDVDDPIMQMGLTALTALDDTRFSLDVHILTEEDAADRLEAGKLAAYVVVPEGFMDAAMYGELIPLKMVTSSGAANIVSIFKDEVTTVIANMVLEAQKGVFGMMDGFSENDIPYQQQLVDELAFQYVDYILCRGDAYTLQELGIADELRFTTYLLCGLSVLLMMLACLPFAPLMIRRDHALGRMLAAKQKPLWKQCLWDFGAYFAGLAAIFFILLVLGAAALAILAPDMLGDIPVGAILVNVLSVLLMAAALSYLLYSLASDLISGVLLQFFLSVAMCFVSGCMYPVYFFPQELQRLSAMFPTGIARSQLAGIFTGHFDWANLGLLFAISLVCFCGGTAARIGSAKNGGR